MIYAGKGGHCSMRLFGQCVDERTGHGREIKRKAHIAIFDLDIADHIQIDHILAQFGIDDLTQRVQNLCVGDHGVASLERVSR